MLAVTLSAGACWNVMPTIPISPRRLCPLRKKTRQITCLEVDVKGFTNAAGAGMRMTAWMQEVGQRRSSCRGVAISRLVSLVPKPRINLTRFHGVFAPHSKYRALVTPAKRGTGKKVQAADQAQDQTSAERRASMAGFCSCKTGIHAIPGNSRFLLLQNRHTCHPWQ